MITFSAKDITETVAISFDFSELLETPGETITTGPFSIAVLNGSDPAVTSMLTASEVIAAGIVTRLVRLGVANVDYLISCLATTDQGQVLKLAGILPVRAQT